MALNACNRILMPIICISKMAMKPMTVDDNDAVASDGNGSNAYANSSGAINNCIPHHNRNTRCWVINRNITRRAYSQSNRTKRMTKYSCACLLLYGLGVNAFSPPSRRHLPTGIKFGFNPTQHIYSSSSSKSSSSTSSTSLDMVWWFGGTPGESETSTSGEECELVAVRIDRTSPNSRRIAGEIVVDASLQDVWAILTDYDNLSTHVPNLVASRRISNGGGEAGDGSHKCRLYQRGAQKIIGFEFGADVTMDMTENVVVAGKSTSSRTITKSHSTDTVAEVGAGPTSGVFAEERRIDFKCIDSQFFSEFDGSWRVVQMPDNPFTGEAETTVSYTVEVRPKGPVPVAALEWRIREVSAK